MPAKNLHVGFIVKNVIDHLNAKLTLIISTQWITINKKILIWTIRYDPGLNCYRY